MALNLVFENITLHNFGSYGHADVNLSNKGFCLVSGKNNYKKDNAVSNGSGKSFLWSGICFALTGETIQGLHTNLKNINIDEDESYASIEFKNGADKYIVTRYIAPKSDLKIIQNGTDISGKGIRESEKKLGEILPELTRDLIASTIIVGQGMPNKFSSFSPSGRKDLLEKLTKSDFMIEDIKNRVVGRQAELERQIRVLEDSLLLNNNQLTQDRNRLAALKEDEKNKKRPDFDKQLQDIDDKIKAYQKDIDKADKEMKKVEGKLTKVSEDLFAKTKEQSAAATNLQENYNKAFQQIIKKQTDIESAIKTGQAEIIRLKNIKDVCPTCGQKIPGAIKPDTSKQEAELEENKKLLEAVKKELTECNSKNAEYKKQISEAFDADVNKLRAEETNLRKEVNKYKDDINDYKHYQDLEKEAALRIKYEKDNWDNARKQAAKAIQDLETSVAGLLSTVTLIENNKALLQEHLAVNRKMKTLTERDFRGFLLTNIIAYLDKKAKDYSELVFGTRDLTVYLDGNALDISYCNKLVDCLSGGEKQRVDLILQLAIRDLLSNYFNFNSNILVLDEITDYLDKKACEAIMNLLSTAVKDVESVFIISHHADELGLAIDTELKVVKNENGISEVL